VGCLQCPRTQRRANAAALAPAQEWNERQKEQRMARLAGEEEAGEGEEEDDGVPFACLLCRRPWEEAPDPVVTLCRHHFCEACALAHNVKSAKCFVCGTPTQGIFNVAHDVLKKLKRARAAKGAG